MSGAVEPTAAQQQHQALGRPPLKLKRCARVHITPHGSPPPPPRSNWQLAGVHREEEGCGAAAAAVAKGETLALQVKRAGAGAAKLVSADPLACLAATETGGVGGWFKRSADSVRLSNRLDFSVR